MRIIVRSRIFHSLLFENKLRPVFEGALFQITSIAGIIEEKQSTSETMLNKIEKLITLEEFRQYPETNQHIELIHGEIIMAPSPHADHQDIVLNFALLLKQLHLGKVVIAPMDVYLDERNALQPDVFWLAVDSQCVQRDGYYYGAPELVIEVHSPATATRDKREKFKLYEQHGVKEYWMIEPTNQNLEVWHLEGARFQRLGLYEEGEGFDSPTLNQTITLQNIFPKS